MRKKDIRQDSIATSPATSSDPAADTPQKTEAAKLEIPKVEAAPIDLPKLEAAIHEASKHETPTGEAPKLATNPPGVPAHDAPKIDSPPHDPPRFEPPRPDALKFDPLKTAAAFRAKEVAAVAATAEATRPRTNRFPLLAASVALAAALGGVLGTLATAGVAKFSPAPPVAATSPTPVAAAPATTVVTKSVVDPQWKEAMARVRSDIAALKADVEASHRAISAHFSKIGDRFDRSERAQAEPATKIARIIETLDRIELRTAAAAVAAPPAAAPAAAPATTAAPATPDTTGSIPSDGRPKPPVVDGWVLRQVFDGFALIEGFNGRLFEVGPGSNIPGIGRVETIRKQEGQWVVVTPKGIISR